MNNRLDTPGTRVLDVLHDSIRGVRDVSSAMHPEDAVSAIATMIAAAARTTEHLIEWLERTHDGHDMLPALRTAYARLVDAATNDAFDGLFDAAAITRYAQWPPAAVPHAWYDDELMYVVHDEHGDIYGSPELSDGHVFLWYWDPKTAAAHLGMLRAQRAITKHD